MHIFKISFNLSSFFVRYKYPISASKAVEYIYSSTFAFLGKWWFSAFLPLLTISFSSSVKFGSIFFNISACALAFTYFIASICNLCGFNFVLFIKWVRINNSYTLSPTYAQVSGDNKLTSTTFSTPIFSPIY